MEVGSSIQHDLVVIAIEAQIFGNHHKVSTELSPNYKKNRVAARLDYQPLSGAMVRSPEQM
jgi:hypothetical protein